MAETEQGYYDIHNMLPYYADKRNLSNWVVVCTDPVCNHEIQGENTCDARIDDGFQLYDGRLYYSVNAERYPELSAGRAHGQILISTALDGTDRWLAYAPEEGAAVLPDSQKTIMLPDRWVVFASYLNTDGTATGCVFPCVVWKCRSCIRSPETLWIWSFVMVRIGLQFRCRMRCRSFRIPLFSFRWL